MLVKNSDPHNRTAFFLFVIMTKPSSYIALPGVLLWLVLHVQIDNSFEKFLFAFILLYITWIAVCPLMFGHCLNKSAEKYKGRYHKLFEQEDE